MTTFSPQQKIRERTAWMSSLHGHRYRSNPWLVPETDAEEGEDWLVSLADESVTQVISPRSKPPLTGHVYSSNSFVTRALIFHQSTHRAESAFREVFVALAASWEEETMFISSLERQILHESYQRIIGLGPSVLPLILERLRDNGGNWFWALRAISGEDPISKNDYGNFKRMREIWLAWGTAQRLI